MPTLNVPNSSQSPPSAVVQLAGELDAVAVPALALIDPNLANRFVQHLLASSAFVVPLLESDRYGAETCEAVMAALWPHGLPETCGRAEWWDTPLGRVCGRTFRDNNAAPVSRKTAAAMLGVTAGTVATLESRGKLLRAHGVKGINHASILSYGAKRQTRGDSVGTPTTSQESVDN